MRPPTTDEADGIFAKQPHLEPRCGRLVKTAPDLHHYSRRNYSNPRLLSANGVNLGNKLVISLQLLC